MYNTPDDDYRAFREVWMRVCKNISQIGMPVVLCGCAVPKQFEPLGDRKSEAQRRYVTELVESIRALRCAGNNVSHDLKTPLTSIMSYVELLAKEDGLPEHVNDYVRILAQKTDRLKNLIQDLFELSKATSNDMSLDMEKLDLARPVNQVLADMQEPIDASGLSFKVNVPDEPMYTVSDGSKLYRVLHNLQEHCQLRDGLRWRRDTAAFICTYNLRDFEGFPVNAGTPEEMMAVLGISQDGSGLVHDRPVHR